MDLEQIHNIEDLAQYIRENLERIFVREQIDGKWDSYSLKQLPHKLRNNHIQRFLNEGRIPAVYLGPLDELLDDQED